MGTTNQKMPTQKQVRKQNEEMKKKAKERGWQSMAYKFYDPKGKK